MPFKSFYISFLAKDFFTEEDWYNHNINTELSNNPNVKLLFNSYKEYQNALMDKNNVNYKKAKEAHRYFKQYDNTLFYLKATVKEQYFDVTLYNTPKNFNNFKNIKEYKIMNGGLDIIHNNINSTADLYGKSYFETIFIALTNIFMGVRSLLTEPKNYVIKNYVTSKKMHSNKRKKKKNVKKNTVYVNSKIIYINKPEDLDLKHKTFIRRTKSWTVSGHWRTLSNGKTIWINPYIKGDKNISTEDKTYILSNNLTN